METKQTAFDWLISQLQKTRNYQRVINEANESGSTVMDVIEQAKEMEKEQIETAWDDGNILGRNGLVEEEYNTGSQYYKQTYGGKNE